MTSHMLLIASIIVAALVLIYKFLIFPIFFSPLSSIPKAHFTSRFCSIWIWWVSDYQNRENRTIHALHKRLGPIVQLSPTELSVNSVEGLRVIYIGGFSKHEDYLDMFMNYGKFPNAASMLHAAEHSVRRRILSRVYSKSVLMNSDEMRIIAQEIIWNRLVPLFENRDVAHLDVCTKQGSLNRYRLEHEKCFDVFAVFESVGMDFVSAYLFGLGNGTDFIRDEKYRDHWLGSYGKSKLESAENRAFGYIEKSCLDMCDLAEKSISEAPDGTSEADRISTKPVVYSQLRNGIDLHETKAKVSDDDDASTSKRLNIASEMLDHMVASHETLGIAMSYMFYELSRDQELQRKLREELLTLSPSLFSNGGIEKSEKGERQIPAFRDIDSLPLLNAILQETLRVYAPAPGMLSRVTPSSEKPVVIEGYQIPGGITVGSSAYTLHRNPDLFPEPDEWRPSRWLDADSDALDRMRKSFWVFGSGGRMCLGNHFAIQVIKTATAAIYTNYISSVVDDEGIEQEDAFIAPPVAGKVILGFSKCV